MGPLISGPKSRFLLEEGLGMIESEPLKEFKNYQYDLTNDHNKPKITAQLSWLGRRLFPSFADSFQRFGLILYANCMQIMKKAPTSFDVSA